MNILPPKFRMKYLLDPNLTDFLKMSFGQWRQFRRSTYSSSMFEHFERWSFSLRPQANPIADRSPWMVFPAIDFLKRILKKDSRVFEYGSGGSTLFFSDLVGELVTVEHDPNWFEVVAREMNESPFCKSNRWRTILAEPVADVAGQNMEPSDALSYRSSDEQYQKCNFREYCSTIDEYPNEYFDLVVIDGRARPSCFMHSAHKVKVGGYIVLDNAERDTYQFIEESAAKLGFIITDFWAPGPYNRYGWRTIFLERTRVYHGLNDLDKKLETYLDFDGGVFIEAGANDGIRQSNSLYFESHRGWRGILVEPVPQLYEECKRNRPDARVVWGALAAPEDVPGTVVIRYAGLMSIAKGSFSNAELEDQHVGVGCEIQKLETYEVEAPCLTLAQVIEDAGLQNIDLLCLDLEGMEASALKGLDFNKNRPRYILVEARFKAEVDNVLADHYEFVDLLSHHDVLYRVTKRKDN